MNVGVRNTQSPGSTMALQSVNFWACMYLRCTGCAELIANLVVWEGRLCPGKGALQATAMGLRGLAGPRTGLRAGRAGVQGVLTQHASRARCAGGPTWSTLLLGLVAPDALPDAAQAVPVPPSPLPMVLHSMRRTHQALTLGHASMDQVSAQAAVLSCPIVMSRPRGGAPECTRNGSAHLMARQDTTAIMPGQLRSQANASMGRLSGMHCCRAHHIAL